MIRFTTGALAALFAGTALAPVAASAQETELKVIMTFPRQLSFAKTFDEYAAKVNEAGKGKVKITIQGGPEAIPQPQQAEALAKGLVDIQWGPVSTHGTRFKAGDALVGATKSPSEVRANGGWAKLNPYMQKDGNAELLGWFMSGLNFYVYTIAEPKMGADGMPDLKGLKIRSNPIYREFFDKLGIVNVVINMPEVYTALERNTVDGLAFPLSGAADLGWQKFIKYRITPGFFQSDTIAMVNKDKWASLSPEVKDILTKVAVEHEAASAKFAKATEEEAHKKLSEAGVKLFELKGAAAEKFTTMGYETVWDRLKARAGEQAHAELKPLFYK